MKAGNVHIILPCFPKGLAWAKLISVKKIYFTGKWEYKIILVDYSTRMTLKSPHEGRLVFCEFIPN